jgi:hypothetical protein
VIPPRYPSPPKPAIAAAAVARPHRAEDREEKETVGQPAIRLQMLFGAAHIEHSNETCFLLSRAANCFSEAPVSTEVVSITAKHYSLSRK